MADTFEKHGGYRNPPKRTRFQKGRSGNPKGRPKREESFGELVRQELNKRIRVKENGRVIRITKREAWLRRIVNGAINRKARAQRTLFRIAKPTGTWLASRRLIFYLIDSEYKDKKRKS